MMQSGIMKYPSRTDGDTQHGTSVIRTNSNHTTHIIYSSFEENENENNNIVSKCDDDSGNTTQSHQTDDAVKTSANNSSECDTIRKRVTFDEVSTHYPPDDQVSLVELTIDDETGGASDSNSPRHRSEKLNRPIKTESMQSTKSIKIVSPRRKECPFQAREQTRENDKRKKERVRKSVTELKKRFALPDRMDKQRNNPAVNWERAIADAKLRLEKQRRSERPWLHGTEMSSFFHKLWQQDTIGPKTPVRRTSSLPKNFRLPELRRKSKDDPNIDLGILRECCCAPRSRIRTFSFTEH